MSPAATSIIELIGNPIELIRAIQPMMAALQKAQLKWLSIDTETNGDNPHQDTVFTLQLYGPWLDLWVNPVVADLRAALNPQSRLVLNQLFGMAGVTKLFQNGKFDLKMLAALGIDVPPPYFDTLLAGQILTCGQQVGCKLGDLTLRYLNRPLDKGLQSSFLGLPPDAIISSEQVQYGAEDVRVLPELVVPMNTAVGVSRSARHTQNRETALLPVLADLELGGVRFRDEEVKRLHEQLQNELRALRTYVQGYLPGIPTVWGEHEPPNLDDARSVKAAMLAAGIPYNSDKSNDLLKQTHYPGVGHLLTYRAMQRRAKQVEQWQALELRSHREGWGQGNSGGEQGQFHLLPNYSQISREGGRLGGSRTGIEAVLPVLEDEQEALLTRLLMPRSEGRRLIGVRLREGALRVLAQVSGNAALHQIYAEGNSAIEWLSQQTGLEITVCWALWMGCGVYGYRKPGRWQEFYYEATGVALPIMQVKGYLTRFWDLMPELKQWHQRYPTPKQGCYTLSGRYCQNYRASHAQKMGHRVLGSLDDLIKAAMVGIDRELRPQGGRSYLVLGDYLTWEVPAERQMGMLDQATGVLKGRARAMLPEVVKEYGDWAS